MLCEPHLPDEERPAELGRYFFEAQDDERIREELRGGKPVISAVDAGFSKAWWTIVDTHVTTIVSCAFLFQFGTGPVRGFAVTLLIGLVANVFTAVFVSKVIFDYELRGKKQLTTLSI